MSGTETTAKTFYYAVGKYRRVTGLGTPMVNQKLCRFGRGGDVQKCDNVHDRTTCRGTRCNLVDMDHRRAQGGDSGGPWYLGGVAYGVHSGAHYTGPGPLNFTQRDQFTPIYNTLNDLGVRLSK